MKLQACIASLACAAALSLAGCRTPPGKPVPGDETKRPDQVLDFPILYARNCAGCHGNQGRNGAAISLANPVYLGVAGEANIERVTATGVHGTTMPPFTAASGGLLTAQQVHILAEGMIAAWGSSSASATQASPAYAATKAGDPNLGQKVFTADCARCHGADGTGIATGDHHTGSLVDPAYLALISDQGLRSIVIAGEPEEGMPGWQAYPAGPLTDADITNVVAWLAAKRVATPGQPYR
jgi:cytochrome c oxidase cbb3-type subunit 3/ubiquinol-cytochrome c reductase cytochrome c subunit